MNKTTAENTQIIRGWITHIAQWSVGHSRNKRRNQKFPGS
jgi:hypothetical protein